MKLFLALLILSSVNCTNKVAKISVSEPYPFVYNADRRHGLYLERINEFDVRLIRKNNTDQVQSKDPIGHNTNHLMIYKSGQKLYKDYFWELCNYPYGSDNINPGLVSFDTIDIYRIIMYNGKDEKFYAQIFDMHYDMWSNKVEINLKRENYDRKSYYDKPVEIFIENLDNKEIKVIVKNNLDFKFYLKYLYMQAEIIGMGSKEGKVFQLRDYPFVSADKPSFLKPNEVRIFTFDLCKELALNSDIELMDFSFDIKNKLSDNNNRASLFLPTLKCK